MTGDCLPSMEGERMGLIGRRYGEAAGDEEKWSGECAVGSEWARIIGGVVGARDDACERERRWLRASGERLRKR